MDSRRFDALTRALHDTHSRRGALAILLSGTLGLFGLTAATAKKKKKKKKGKKKGQDPTTQLPVSPPPPPPPPTCSPACGPCQACVGGACFNAPNNTLCADDGNPCTSDVCSNGTCVHTFKIAGGACGVNGVNGVCCNGGVCCPAGRVCCSPPTSSTPGTCCAAGQQCEIVSNTSSVCCLPPGATCDGSVSCCGAFDASCHTVDNAKGPLGTCGFAEGATVCCRQPGGSCTGDCDCCGDVRCSGGRCG